MNSKSELKQQISELMHELIAVNQKIFDEGEYTNLLALCKQDISILDMLDNNTNLTAKEISTRLNVPKTTAITAVSRLVKRGYITRKQNENDKREQFLCLTEKGIKANSEHIGYETVFLESLVKRWTEEDQKELAKLLKRRRNDV